MDPQILLIDDLDSLNLSQDAMQNLRWLLLRGPSRLVWPIVSRTTSKKNVANDDLNQFFRTRLFGQIDSPNVKDLLTNDRNFQSPQDNQFVLKEGDKWLRFWVPIVQ